MRMDSELVVRQLSGIYQIRKSRFFRFYQNMEFQSCRVSNISFVHILEKNKEADALSNIAMDESEQGVNHGSLFVN